MNAQKKQVNQEQFQKQVEIEYSYLVYENHVDKTLAYGFAVKNTHEKYEIVN